MITNQLLYQLSYTGVGWVCVAAMEDTSKRFEFNASRTVGGRRSPMVVWTTVAENAMTEAASEIPRI